MMDQQKFALAHVAMLELTRLARRRRLVLAIVGDNVFRRENIWCGEHRAAAQFSNASRVQQRFFARDLCRIAVALGSLEFLPAQHRIGVINLGHSLMQALAILLGQAIKQRTIGRNGFKQCDARSHVVDD